MEIDSAAWTGKTGPTWGWYFGKNYNLGYGWQFWVGWRAVVNPRPGYLRWQKIIEINFFCPIRINTI